MCMDSPAGARLLAALSGLLFVGGVLAAGIRMDEETLETAPPLREETMDITRSPAVRALVRPPPRAARAATPGSGVSAVTDERAWSAPRPEGPARGPRDAFAAAFPAQASARQVEGDPASFSWALIVGINQYARPTQDTAGSRPDARVLRDHLRSLGWRSDHILLLADRDATAHGIVRAIRWLASRTDARSTVVFHYSGHERPHPGDADRDGEGRDVALWASDNRLVVDGRLGAELGRVRAARMWIHIAACRAGGFDDPGMSRPGRLITYSSPERELSYEDRLLRHSVFGYYTIVEAMAHGRGDANRDGTVTVEEAFAYARPLVVDHTGGRQHPLKVDRLPGQFSLRVPAAARPGPEPTRSPCALPLGCPGARD